MKELTLQDFREIVSLHKNAVDIHDWSDKNLLEANLSRDVGLDSLDIIDIVAEFEVKHGVYIDNEAFDNRLYPAAINADVRTLLKVCNECLK